MCRRWGGESVGGGGVLAVRIRLAAHGLAMPECGAFAYREQHRL